MQLSPIPLDDNIAACTNGLRQKFMFWEGAHEPNCIHHDLAESFRFA